MASSTAASWSRWGEWPQSVQHEPRGPALARAPRCGRAARACRTRRRGPASAASAGSRRRSGPRSTTRGTPGSSQVSAQPRKASSTCAWYFASRALRSVVPIGLADAGDALDGLGLDEHVRRHQHEAGDRPAGGRGVNERDGGPVRMPDQQRALDVELIQQGGQDVERLLVHEAGRARGERARRTARSRSGSRRAPARRAARRACPGSRATGPPSPGPRAGTPAWAGRGRPGSCGIRSGGR